MSFWFWQVVHELQRGLPRGWGWVIAGVLGERVMPEAVGLSLRVVVRLLRVILAI